MEIKVVELFAGVGGFRLGIEAVSNDFNFVFANQWEPGKTKQHAYECYISHFGKDSCVNEDIALIKHTIPDHDLLVGGFPCQDYSVASTGAKGIEGKKGVLWWEIRDIIEMKKPKYVLLENVDRLLKSPSNKRGRDFAVIVKSLNDLGYVVEWRTINAAEYNNVQRRKRVFILAYTKDTHLYTSIVKDEKNIPDTRLNCIFHATLYDSSRNNFFSIKKYKNLKQLSDNFSGKFWNSGIAIDYAVYTKDVKCEYPEFKPLKSILQTKVDVKYFLSSEKLKKMNYLRGAKKIERVRPDGIKYFYSEGAMSKHDDVSLPSRTMLTSETTINRSSHLIKCGNKYRFLTPVECERLNGFPDGWTDSGMTERMRSFVMGNALVIPIVKQIAEEIFNTESPLF